MLGKSEQEDHYIVNDAVDELLLMKMVRRIVNDTERGIEEL